MYGIALTYAIVSLLLLGGFAYLTFKMTSKEWNTYYSHRLLNLANAFWNVEMKVYKLFNATNQINNDVPCWVNLSVLWVIFDFLENMVDFSYISTTVSWQPWIYHRKFIKTNK